MPDDQKPTGGGDQPSSGSEDKPKGSDENNNSSENDVVSYRSYSKVLTEKKNIQERLRNAEEQLEAVRKEQEQAEENRLKEQNEYKTLYEKTKQELEDRNSKFDGLITDINRQRKLAAFQSALKGSVDPKYHVFVNTDEILMDPESGDIDEMSVTKEVERFVKDHPALVTRPHEKKSTSPYPQGENHLGNTITRAEWLKLPAKEMKKWRMNQIID